MVKQTKNFFNFPGIDAAVATMVGHQSPAKGFRDVHKLMNKSSVFILFGKFVKTLSDNLNNILWFYPQSDLPRSGKRPNAGYRSRCRANAPKGSYFRKLNMREKMALKDFPKSKLDVWGWPPFHNGFMLPDWATFCGAI